MKKFFFMIAAIHSASGVLANPELDGEWMLELNSSGAPIIGLLDLEFDAGNWQGFVEGGPTPVTIDGNDIELVVDSRDIRGFVFFMRLSGVFKGDQLTGTYAIESEAKVNVSDGTWTASRYEPVERPLDADPVDLTGIWKPSPGIDFRKYTMDLTPAADAWLDEYLMHYDQPNVRCASPGITAMVAWGGYPFEILASENRLTFLYEFDSEIRRIFTDGSASPEFYQHSGMGYSTGRWEGKHLVIDTTLLSQNVRDFRGEPVSENARLKEVYSLSDDGKTLSAVITLHDPENYERAPIRRRQWTRDPNTQMYPSECDPDSFYRQMYNENLLDMYFERSRRRF